MSELKCKIVRFTETEFPRNTARTPTAEADWGTMPTLKLVNIQQNSESGFVQTAVFLYQLSWLSLPLLVFLADLDYLDHSKS